MSHAQSSQLPPIIFSTCVHVAFALTFFQDPYNQLLETTAIGCIIPLDTLQSMSLPFTLAAHASANKRAARALLLVICCSCCQHILQDALLIGDWELERACGAANEICHGDHAPVAGVLMAHVASHR